MSSSARVCSHASISRTGVERGRVPYLERVVTGNLTRLSRILRILRFHAHDLRLMPSLTTYMRWGKGPRKRLRFSKNADPKLEEAYSRHFVWPGKASFSHPGPRSSSQGETGQMGP